MTDLWFDQEPGEPTRWGRMLYTASPSAAGPVWAVLTSDIVHPDDLAQESRDVLGQYGACVHGMGHLLHTLGISLPIDLEQWSTAASIPAQDLGSWIPCLISLNQVFQSALSREFTGARAFVTTWAGQYLTVLVPGAELTVALSQRSVPTPSAVPGEEATTSGDAIGSTDPAPTSSGGASSSSPLPETATAEEIAAMR